MNLIPEYEMGAPVGSVDHFTITLTSVDYVNISPDGKWYWVTGWFTTDKLAWQPEGTVPPVVHIYNFSYDWGQFWFNRVEHRLYYCVSYWNLLGTVNQN
ncbi:MAG: hypothetical protein NTY03_01680 [Candidatus Bathyarchaeota archaeon]|jgi:hypothetical protein|nr:hypothetical protein [Candidatus Bathyarchaeota archaeon]